jgi:hypothetical protein
MKSQPNCIIFELAKIERNGKIQTLKYPLPIDADIETNFACFLQQLRNDRVHLCTDDLLRIGSDYATAIVEGFKHGVIPIEHIEVSGVLFEFVNH